MEDELNPSVSQTILECMDTSSKKQLETVITEKDIGQHHDTDSFCTISCQRLIARTDSLLQRYTSWASSYYNADKGIKLFAYLTWLLSRLVTPISSSSNTSCNRVTSNDDLATGLRKIYSEMMMVRYALRLFGLPMSLEAVRTGSWYSGWKDRYIVLLGKIMSWAMVFYYPYEHAAYFHWIAPKLVKADAERCTAISCRFWLAYVCADLASSVLKIKELILRRNGLQNSLSENEFDVKSNEIGALINWNKLHILRNIFYILPCIHWSLPNWERKPWLKEGILNGLLLAESITCFYQSIC